MLSRTPPVYILTLTLLVWLSDAKIMRNNALLSKMMSNYRDKTHSAVSQQTENQPKSGKVLSLMQDVLCRNFPTIPCNLIMHDEKLRELIQESIQEIKHKRPPIPVTETTVPGYELVNSEELSNFLQVKNTGNFDDKESSPKKEDKHKRMRQKVWIKSATKTHSHHDSDQQTFYGKKKIRKFYPHKIKYKDKLHSHHTRRSEYVGGNDQPGHTATIRPEGEDQQLHNEPRYGEDLGAAPIWRIDYTKHGEPRFNVMGLEDSGALMKTPNVQIDKNELGGVLRKDVLHSDVYIKTSYPKKQEEADVLDSEGF